MTYVFLPPSYHFKSVLQRDLSKPLLQLFYLHLCSGSPIAQRMKSRLFSRSQSYSWSDFWHFAQLFPTHPSHHYLQFLEHIMLPYFCVSFVPTGFSLWSSIIYPFENSWAFFKPQLKSHFLYGGFCDPLTLSKVFLLPCFHFSHGYLYTCSPMAI